MYDLRAEHKFGEDRSAPVPRDSFQPLQLGHHVVEYHPPITQQQQQCLLPIAVTAIFVVIFFPSEAPSRVIYETPFIDRANRSAPFRGQSTQNSSGLSPKQGCGTTVNGSKHNSSESQSNAQPRGHATPTTSAAVQYQYSSSSSSSSSSPAAVVQQQQQSSSSRTTAAAVQQQWYNSSGTTTPAHHALVFVTATVLSRLRVCAVFTAREELDTRGYSSSTFPRRFFMINPTSSNLSRHIKRATPDDVPPFSTCDAPEISSQCCEAQIG